MILNEKQNSAILAVSQGKNVFLSGSGGVGKSVTVRKIIEMFNTSTVVMAPTGIAALNIGGMTIHSAFKLGHKILLKSDANKINPKTEQLFSTSSPVKRIIIDEISMVRSDILRIIDLQLRKIRRNNRPFGGLQIIVVGDFYQLPPVLTDNEKDVFNTEYDSPYCFSTETWAECDFEYIELDQVMRQTDLEMINHLNAIRQKDDNYKESVDFFNKYGVANAQDVLDTDPVFLCSTNKSAMQINTRNYSECEGEEKVFVGSRSTDFKGELPVPQELELKFGAKVIIVANSPDYKNGQIGYVTKFIGSKVQVLIEDTEEYIYIDSHTWEQVEYSVKEGVLTRDVIGTYRQLPIKLAWAITVHKAQGQTIPNAIIDMGWGAFAHGQLYVALSRVKSMQGFGLIKNIKYTDVIVDKDVREFYDNGCRGNRLF